MIPKADENGERLDAVQWEDSAEYNRETVIPNDDSWHLEFRDASGQYALAMCMEITDTQNNRHISTIRTVDWGYGSRDLILDHPNLRVIAENGTWCQVVDDATGECGFMMKKFLLDGSNVIGQEG
jgi:hypothetical protein